MTEAKEQIFLTTVKSVDIPLKLPKDGSYVFEVRHTGKTSPWILNASSEVSHVTSLSDFDWSHCNRWRETNGWKPYNQAVQMV